MRVASKTHLLGDRSFALATVGFGLVGLGHALYTWPRPATVALFGGGGAIAFIAEATAVRRGALDHHVGSTVLGVPVYVLFGWTGTVYVAFRLALLVTDGLRAVVAGAGLATASDVLSPRQTRFGR